MWFNISSQSGNQIINVAGDQTVYGGQHVMIATPLDVLGTLDMLRAAVADAKLPQAKKRRAMQHVEEMEDELRRPRPDKQTIGDRLKR